MLSFLTSGLVTEYIHRIHILLSGLIHPLFFWSHLHLWLSCCQLASVSRACTEHWLHLFNPHSGQIHIYKESSWPRQAGRPRLFGNCFSTCYPPDDVGAPHCPMQCPTSFCHQPDTLSAVSPSQGCCMLLYKAQPLFFISCMTFYFISPVVTFTPLFLPVSQSLSAVLFPYEFSLSFHLQHYVSKFYIFGTVISSSSA